MRSKINVVLGTIALLMYTCAAAQSPAPKQVAAKRTNRSIKIDGLITDEAWKEAPLLTGFIEYRPDPFRPEDSTNKTEVYMLYSDEGIYLGGYCYEPNRENVSTEINGRDGFGNNDFIGFIFDTYKDKINGFEYFLTPAGEQMDAKVSPNPDGNTEDFSWNAVWQSAAKIHNNGWSFEMFIPFSAIRFSTKTIQDWGVNVIRRRQKTLQQYAWNPIDRNINGFLTQEGVWTGLENIKPPLRLQFSPYLSTYVNHYPSNTPGEKNWTSSFNGGMDVKYGISQALTLDMTLIPDFGQVQSDNQVLNLTPFEVRFNENRAFFTEGTELFSKGNLFYSRRIGGQPLNYYNVWNSVGSNEHIVKNPSETKLVNATKVSGRLQNGLGIGFFNAVTAPQYATIEDDQKNQRKVQTNPLSNYNIIVLNQSLKHNSSVTLVNTNVWRSGADYDANVTAALFDFNDKKNTWNVGGKLATSSLVGYQPDGKNLSGYSHSLYFGKTSGRFNFKVTQDLTNDKFNSNDMGYFTNNNFLDHTGWAGFKWVKPSKWYNNMYLNFNAYYSRRITNPAAYQMANFNINVNGQLKSLWYVGAMIAYEPKSWSFYESRKEGQISPGWSSKSIDIWFESNSTKKYFQYAELLYVMRDLFNSKRYQFNSRQRYRFSKKFSVTHDLFIEPQKRNFGYADYDEATGNIVFGTRDRETVENILTFKYSFSDKMNINTRIRHYWAKVDYKRFFTLQQDGGLADNTTYTGNPDQNYNAFNVDAVFTWQFAPGSFLNAVWKNSAYDFNSFIDKNYMQNFNNTMKVDENNNLSLKVIYFLDYLQLKNKKKKKNQNA